MKCSENVWQLPTKLHQSLAISLSLLSLVFLEVFSKLTDSDSKLQLNGTEARQESKTNAFRIMRISPESTKPLEFVYNLTLLDS